MSLSHILFGLRFFENVLKTIFRNVLIPESVNFSRRDSVQLLADAQWSYYGTRMKEKRRYDHSLTSYLRKFAKKSVFDQFLWFFANNFARRGRISFFIASVPHNMTIAHPPTVERNLYD